jgi:glutamate N-acetyltransferase/amino-acid N-acetyltransferase
MAEMLARDGEGATKLLRARISGAGSAAEARTVAKSIINSPLVKTMAYGADPNIGRILMAVGKCFDCDVDASRLRVAVNGMAVWAGGARLEYDDADLRERLRGDPVDIEVDLGRGDVAITAFGCDLTHGYIDENAAYYSS